jgi:DNA-binding NtrC family response regulator
VIETMNAKANILIVDDEEVVRRSFSSALAAAQCRAEAANDGAEALAAMERKPFDVVLLDLRMPGADGISVLKSMKRRWPASEVVIVTGYPSVESAKEAVRLGACDYLAKPLDPEALVAAANGAIARKRWALRPCERDEGTNCNAATEGRSES